MNVLYPTYVADIWHYRVANEAISSAAGATVIPATFRETLGPLDPVLASLPRDELIERGLIPLADDDVHD
ncbi:MAG: hypothetical protein OSB70_16000 [Myxococcota bacterium]|nr:hypothetical protein [Myxococcota bacterium]